MAADIFETPEALCLEKPLSCKATEKDNPDSQDSLLLHRK